MDEPFVIIPDPLHFTIDQQSANQRFGTTDVIPDVLPPLKDFDKDQGKVFIENFDLGIVETLGGVLNDDPNADVTLSRFVLVLDKELPEAGNKVPVIMGIPEQAVTEYKLPVIFVRRDGLEFDAMRYSQGLIAFINPAPQEQLITVNGKTGYKRYRMRQRAEAYNFFYTIEIYARYKQEANIILQKLLSRVLPYQECLVRDTKEDIRPYTMITEGYAVIDDLVDTTFKVHGYSLSIRIIGELNLQADEVDVPSLIQLDTTVEIIDKAIPEFINVGGFITRKRPLDIVNRIKIE